MRNRRLADMFQRAQVNDAEGRVLRAILSQTNIFGKHAKIAHEVIMAMTGLARSTVYAAIARLEKIRHLLRVERKVLWPGHNAINIYHVVIPWRADPLYDERKRMGWGRKNHKGPGRPDPHIQQKEKSLSEPAQMSSEHAPPARKRSREEAASFLAHLGISVNASHYEDCLAHLLG